MRKSSSSSIRDLLMKSVAALLILCPISASALDEFDVSMLLPLPQKLDEACAIRTTDQATDTSPLLPHGFLRSQLLSLNSTRFGFLDTETQPLLRLVAVRFSGDREEIRVVWQPVVSEGGVSTTLDSAVHVVYPLKRGVMRPLLKSLDALRTPAPESNFARDRIHPVVKQEGLCGNFMRAIRAKILPLLRFEQVKEIAFFENRGVFAWELSAINPSSTENPRTKTFFGDKRIPGLTFNSTQVDTAQALEFDEDGREVRRLDVLGAGPHSSSQQLILDRAAFLAQSKTATTLKAYSGLLGLQNPVQSTFDNTDCVSCHAADNLRTAVETHAVASGGRLLQTLNQGPRNLLPRARMDNLRMFGYFGAEPVVSNYVLNDTRISLDVLR